MENKNLTTLTLDADAKAAEKVVNMPRWMEAKNRLLGILEEAENGTIADFFGSKASGKGASFSYQTLANITFTSAGYIRDKWTKYENEELKAAKRPSVYEFLCKNLVPMTEAELKALAEQQKHEAEVNAKAQGYLESCELNEIKVTAESVKKNAKLLAKFGEEVVNKIVELLNKPADESADKSAEA